MAPPNLREIMLSQPAMKAPPGVTADFVSLAPFRFRIMALFIVLFVLATVVVAIRVYTKIVVVKRLAIEDYLILSAWLLYAGGYQTLSHILLSKRGAGNHQWNIYVRDLIPFLYYMLIANTIYGLVVLQIKSAIIFQCLRVLVPTGTRNAAFWTFYVLLGAHFIFYISCTFVEIFMCNPREKAWDPTIKRGTCMDSKVVIIAAAAINTTSDLILVLVPQVVIWGLNMPLRRKYQVSAVFAVGLLACASSAVWMHYSVDLYHNNDYTWAVGVMAMWVHVEICIGFMVACIPVFPSFFKHQPIFGRVGSSLLSILRIKSSRSTKHTSERLTSSDGSAPKKQPIVTDIEFEELVKRTDLSMLTVEHAERGVVEEIR